MLFERNQVLLAKTETTAGTDSTPTAALNAIKCGVVNVTVDGQEITDPTIRASISASPRRYTNKTVTMNITVAMKGSGTAGTAPEISPLLQSCAMSETIVTPEGESAPTSVEYKPVNSGSAMKTCTIYLFKDGVCYKSVGNMGNMTVSCNAGEFATIQFAMQGKLLSISDISNPSPTYQDVEPTEVKAYGLSFGDFDDAVVRSFGFETGNSVSARKNLNAADGLEPFGVTERNPVWNSNIEAVLEATNPFWASFIDRDTVALDFKHGSTDGNIIEFAAPAANYDAMQDSAEDGINMYGLSGQLLESSGEDNFTLTFK